MGGGDSGPNGEVMDGFGLPITTSSLECAQAVAEYSEAVLAYRPFAAWSAAADAALAGDGRCPMARVLAADCCFCKGDAPRAREILQGLAADVASGASKAWTWREQRYLHAWQRWVNEGDPAGCYDALLEVVVKHPEDLFAVKRGHIMGLILGDGSRILRIVEPAASKADAKPPPRFLHGMWAFALEQEGQFEEAEEKAREGLAFEGELGPDAWLDHALAHALYFQGEDRIDEAREYLSSRGPAWSAESLHPFLYTHCWWHLSLLHCEKRDFSEAIRIFDERLWPDSLAHMRGDPQVQLNALNLLWRLETRGQGALAGPRWEKVLSACRGTTMPAAQGEQAPCQHGDLLLDILMVRGLCAGAAHDANPLEDWLRCIADNAAQIASGSGDGAKSRGEAYGSLAQLVAELYRADQPEAGLPARHAKAKQGIKDLQPRWGCLGGSEEQRCILLEAVEGPVVCGAPEANYDKLFH